MKSLILLRHAKSIKGDPNLKDFDRPLNDVGLSQIPVIAKIFQDENIGIDYIISSPAKRAGQTAQLVADNIGYKGEFKWFDELYEARCEDYIKALKSIPDKFKNAMLVGHNPTQEEFLYLLTGQNELLATASLALIELPIYHWLELTERTQGKLIKVWRPKELME